MIMHPVFIRCTTVTSNCQLLYILVNLAKGGRLRYIDTVFETNDKHVRIHGQSTATIEYMYADKSCGAIVDKIASIIGLEVPAPEVPKTVKSSMIRDFVVGKLAAGEVGIAQARRLCNYITIAQIIKLVTKDFVIQDGKIVDIRNIDLGNPEMELFTSKTEAPKTKRRERMDSHWAPYANSI